MTLKEKINADFKQALKDRDEAKKLVLSTLLSEIKNQEIALGKKETGLNDQEIIAVLSRAVKQRQEAAEKYQQGGREELAKKEQKEVKVIKAYLPRQLNEEELERALRKIIDEMKAAGMQDLGKVMGQAMAKLKGKVEGEKVKKMAQKILSRQEK